MIRRHVRGSLDRALGNDAVLRLSDPLTSGHLRILAYHGVHDGLSFQRHMEFVAKTFHPVSADDVVAALEGLGLPARAVWVTFDDGDPTVVEVAGPIMHALGIPSTVFVCPGLVDTAQPYWWEVVLRADELGIRPPCGGRAGPDLVAALKRAPDERRRQLVAHLAERMEPMRRRQLTTEELRMFVGMGGTVANHTWDHPCLDRCTPEAQRGQIVRADRWLRARFPEMPPVCAYPNGDRTTDAAAVLQELGYRLGLLFDHRLASLGQPRYATSRLRVDDHTTLPRFKAIISGAHPLMHRMRSRYAGRPSGVVHGGGPG